MSDVIVHVKNVQKTYKQGSIEVHALRGVTLELARGEFAVLAGSSGSGKTTLLNLVGALDVPTTGEIDVEGRMLSSMTGKDLAELRLRRLGFVFQAYNLIPVLSAYENAEYVMLLQGEPAEKRREKVMKVLESVGLKGMENRRPTELSGGQQQRVAVARAIASEPALVLADEPTANLDSKTGSDLVATMRKLNEEHGITFLISSHDPKVIRHAARVIRLEDGAIVSDERQNGKPAVGYNPVDAATEDSEAWRGGNADGEDYDGD
ncbi:MAG: ABC transporter ATP-binding protein [Myxococcales bacterium]|nr:ABC transporter ATP-binding protein [Myxococcales bacterium]